MGGKSSQVKGRENERKARAVLENVIGGLAHKLSAQYVKGPDALWRGELVEIKVRNTNQSFSMPDKLLDGDATITMLRADRGQWVISMRPETLARLLNAPRECGCECLHEPTRRNDDPE